MSKKKFTTADLVDNLADMAKEGVMASYKLKKIDSKECDHRMLLVRVLAGFIKENCW